MTHAIDIQALRGSFGRLRLGRRAKLVLAGGSLALLAAIGAQRLIAQIEGERGIAPVASSQDIHVTGIVVNVSADTADEARTEGWKVAQRKAWEKIHGPKISDAQLDSMVSAIVIEHEQVGPRRYVARLGVIFDRTRAGQFVGAADGGLAARSAPMLVIPVLYSGGARQVFEVRGPWQRAWANFQTSASRVDYIRPTGAGGESLILNAGQPGRRSRIWWRNVLDQFNAADVVVPVARLDRQWPGGPVRGTFTARYGPDNTFIESFTLTARNDNEVPAMLDKALVRIDGIYQRALADGMLQPDPSLMAEQHALDAMLAQLASKLAPMIADAPDSVASAAPSSLPAATASTSATVATYTVQFATPDAAAVDSALAAVRNASGVQGAATTSLAIGGTSVMRVTVTGSLDSLAAALRAQGWQVAVGANALRISR